MKRFFLPIMVVAIIIALFVPKESQYGLYIKIIAIAVFMLGMMRLMAKIPTKKSDSDEQE